MRLFHWDLRSAGQFAHPLTGSCTLQALSDEHFNQNEERHWTQRPVLCPTGILETCLWALSAPSQTPSPFVRNFGSPSFASGMTTLSCTMLLYRAASGHASWRHPRHKARARDMLTGIVAASKADIFHGGFSRDLQQELGRSEMHHEIPSGRVSRSSRPHASRESWCSR